MPPQEGSGSSTLITPIKQRFRSKEEEESDDGNHVDIESDARAASPTNLPLLLVDHYSPPASPIRSDHHRREHHDQKYSIRSVILLARRYLLLLANIAAWYTTNGLNGISMQSFAATIPSEDGSSSSSMMVMVYTKGTVTVLVTAFQLLLGALLGRIMLHVYHNLASSTTSSHTDAAASSSAAFHKSKSSNNLSLFGCSKTTTKTTTARMQTCLAGLHAAGSVCTNLGFMNGKASLVQVIKLMEPFETLLFTKLLIREEGDLFTTGVVSSMCLTLGAALSLLPNKSSSKQTNMNAAILFATLSGLSLSLRNVLQRRQHASSAAAAASTTTTAASAEEPSASSSAAHHVSHTTTPDKLERALVLYTQISWHSGRLLLLLSLGLVTMAPLFQQQNNESSSSSLYSILQHGLNVGLLTWHPAYNAFSMITLGYCSAVTHSLLNAGKRVYAIVMAILWFREGFTAQTATGLFLVLLGGCWYTVEMKCGKTSKNNNKKSSSTTTTTGGGGTVSSSNAEKQQSSSSSVRGLKRVPFWVKPMLALILLRMHWTAVATTKIS